MCDDISHSQPQSAVDVTLFCPECDYNFTGLPQNRCPECGQKFDPVWLTEAMKDGPKPITLGKLVILAFVPPALFALFSLLCFLADVPELVLAVGFWYLMCTPFYAWHLAVRMAVTRARRRGSGSGLQDRTFIFCYALALYACNVLLAIGFPLWLERVLYVVLD